jgi:GNAT superfamily N-acetyltransferase
MNMNEIFVREGVVEDFNELMRMSIAATRENAFVEPDEMMLAQHMYAALSKQMGIAGVIGGAPGEPLEAAIVLRVGPMWYSPELILEEKAIYVCPEFRSAKGGRARKLSEWAKGLSEKLGIPLAIGVLSNTRTEAKIRLYQRVFGPPAGVYFLYNAKTGLTEG